MKKKIVITSIIILILFLMSVTSEAAIKIRPWDYLRFNTIAYSKIKDYDAPINTAEHFLICGRLDCYTSLKADVRISKDNGLILCHDKGFTLNENGRIVNFDKNRCVLISELTTEQCLSLEHENDIETSWHFKVTDFETFIIICKRYGKIPFITVRDERIDDIISVMMPILEKYDLTDKCIINSFTTETLEKFHEANKEIMLSKVLKQFEPLSKEIVDWAIEMENCLITLYDLPESELSEIEQNREMISYANKNNVMIYEAISGTDNVEDLVSIGIQGGQFTAIVADDAHDRKISFGDINEDGQINIVDLLLFKKLLVGEYRTQYQDLIKGDLNLDENVTITDLLLIKKKIVNNE